MGKYLGFLLFFCVSFFSAFAQDLQVRLNTIEIKDFPQIEVDFTVFESSGNVLAKLERHHISLVENGHRIDNYFMQISNDPLQLVLVLDDSGSMNGHLDFLKKAVLGFLRILSDQDRCMILSFSDIPRILSNFDATNEEREKSLEKLKGYGPTALYDAIFMAADLLPESGKTAIVILSDGVDQNREHTSRQSSKSAVDAVSRAVHKNIPVHTIGLGGQINRKELKDFSRLSSGSFYYAPSSRQLQDLYSTVARNLKSDIKIKYVSPDEKKGASFRNLELEIRTSTNLGRSTGNYFSPGKFVVETSGFGFNSKQSQGRDVDMKVKIIDDNQIEKTGGKEFVQSWINHLGK